MAETKSKINGRLRTSCDQCSRAKLKCSFDGQQACARCEAQKTLCTRSTRRPVKRHTAKEKQKSAANFKTLSPAEVDIPTPITPSSVRDPYPGNDGIYQSLDFIGSPMLSPFDESTLDANDSEYHTMSQDLSDMFVPAASWCSPEHQHPPLATICGDPIPAQPDLPFRDNLSSTCTCFVAITCAMRDPKPEFLKDERSDDMLRLLKDSLSTVGAFLVCKSPHDTTLMTLVCVFLHKITATFSKILGIMSEPVFQFGCYTIEGEDGHALKRKIVLIGVGKLKVMLDQPISNSEGVGVERFGANRSGAAKKRFWSRLQDAPGWSGFEVVERPGAPIVI